MEFYIANAKIYQKGNKTIIKKPYARKAGLYVLYQGFRKTGERIIEYCPFSNCSEEILLDAFKYGLKRNENKQTNIYYAQNNREWNSENEEFKGFDMERKIERYTDFLFECSFENIKFIVREENITLVNHSNYVCATPGCGILNQKRKIECSNCGTIEKQWLVSDDYIHKCRVDYQGFNKSYQQSKQVKNCLSSIQNVRFFK